MLRCPYCHKVLKVNHEESTGGEGAYVCYNCDIFLDEADIEEINNQKESEEQVMDISLSNLEPKQEENKQLMAAIEFVKKNHETITAEGGKPERVGEWVWIEFSSKPSAELRAALKGNGFRWIDIRGKWANPCGKSSRHGKGDPRDRYGSEEL